MLLLKIGIATLFILLPTVIRSAIELWATYTDQKEVKAFTSRMTWAENKYEKCGQFRYVTAETLCIFQPWLLLISCTSLREKLISIFKKTREIDSVVQYERQTHSITINHNWVLDYRKKHKVQSGVRFDELGKIM